MKTEETARVAAETAKEKVESAREATRRKANAVSEAVDQGKAAYRRELEKARAS